MATNQVRVSSRTTKGVPPTRYGDKAQDSRGAPVTQPFSIFENLAVEDLEQQLETNRGLLQMCTQKKAEMQVILEEFDGKDEDTLSTEESEKKRDAKREMDIAVNGENFARGRIQEYQNILQRKRDTSGAVQGQAKAVTFRKATARSVKSSASARRKEIEVDKQKKLIELKRDLTNKQTEYTLAERDLNRKRSLLQQIQEQVGECEAAGKSTDKLKEKEAEYTEDFQTAEERFTHAQVSLEALQSLMEDEQKLILAEAEAQLEIVDSDQDLDEEDCAEAGQGLEDRVESWMDNSHHHERHYPQGPPTPNTHNPSYSRQRGDTVTINNLVSALRTLNPGSSNSKNYELPKFDGNPSDFLNFLSEYKRSCQQYSESENHSRMIKALKGQALETVKHLLSNYLNLNKIWSVLEKRFGRPEFVLDFLVEAVRATKKVEVSKPETLIDFATAVDSLAENCRNFNEEDYLHSRQLAKEFSDKLPAELRSQWYEWLQDGTNRKPNLEYFSVWIARKSDAAILSVRPKVETKVKEDRREEKRRRAPGAVNAQNGEVEKKACEICQKGPHSTLASCDKFRSLPVDQRWKLAKKEEVCLACLRYGHRLKFCRKKEKCSKSGCDKYHHSLLHGDKKNPPSDQPISPSAPPPANPEFREQGGQEGGINLALIDGCDGPLPIVPVKVRGPNGVRHAYALLDSGASRSLITASLANTLGLPGKPTRYSYRAINGDIVYEDNARVITCEVTGSTMGRNFSKLNSAVTVQRLGLKPYSINLSEIRKRWPHLRAVKGKNLNQVVPDIIVGNDNPDLSLARKIVSGPPGTPVGWQSTLGWTVSGKILQSSGGGSMNLTCGVDDMMHDMIKQAFTTEAFGVMVPKSKGINLEEKRAYSILESTSRKVGDRWEVGLLWKEDSVVFPSSEEAAFRRLNSVEKKFQDPVYKKLYVDKIEEINRKGFVRKLDSVQAASWTERTWYLPQFGVVNPNKPGKIRLVLDAAAKVNGISLNDKLLKGPDLIRPLTAVLWNFRIHKYALTGDIADMFHRVLIREEDRRSQRFLWRDGVSTREPDHYEMVVMIFGATSSPSSAIFVKNKNAEQFQEKYTEASRAIVEDFYVDDCLTGADSIKSAVQLREEISAINKSGGFHVTKWNSNSIEVMESIPSELRADGIKLLDEKSELPVERVLGLWWEPSSDNFTFRLNLHKVPQEILHGRVPTKRELCSLVMSIFDPLGLVNYFKVKGMILLQSTWLSGIGWDEKLPDDICAMFTKWRDHLPMLKEVQIPRMYSNLLSEKCAVQLHTFVDASEEAFCAVSYFRISEGSKVEVSLVASKVRVSPMKKLTIPRLELQAAVLGCRLANTIRTEVRVKVNKIYFWTDSKTVLQWLRSPAIKFKEFVANRVGEIQECSDPQDWNWVSTTLNVADDATRFHNDSFSKESQDRWFTGPEFLLSDPSTWLCEEGSISTVKVECDTKDETTKEEEFALFPISSVSSYDCLLRKVASAIAAARTWIHYVPKSTESHETGRTREKDFLPFKVNLEDIHAAEMILIKFVQQVSFREDYFAVKNGRQPKQGKLLKLSPFLSDGVLRVRSRLMDAKNLEMEVKAPIILPSKHHFTDLLIQREHEKCAHQGKETVLNNLRRKGFWIIDGRSAVSRVFYNCQVCKLRRARPIIPEMGNIPNFRLASYRPAFTFTGLDYYGPLETTVGRHHEKRWGVLFCCMVTRAVHMEVAYSLSTDEAIMAISRFIDARGRPHTIISDNGTNFIGANRELKEEWGKLDQEKIRQYEKFHDIKWNFNPPAAPAFGGVWERLIQSVKKCLMFTLREKYPKDTTLLTAIKAAENIVNSRPITQVSLDPDDGEAITPNHILRGSCDQGPGIPALLDDSNLHIRSQWKRSQILANQFWEKWTNDYLPKLLLREKWHCQQEPIRIGDLVFMVDENSPRNTWKRGYISQVFPGKDGQVRVVEVTTTEKVYRRPVSKVCPLGLRMNCQDMGQGPEGAGMSEEQSSISGVEPPV